jgi:hypothetical protein
MYKTSGSFGVEEGEGVARDKEMPFVGRGCRACGGGDGDKCSLIGTAQPSDGQEGCGKGLN